MARSRVPHEVDIADIKKHTSIPEMETFAKTFNQLLIEKKIHQDDLARDIGISTGSISSYRNGKKEPRLSMIVKIADYLDVDCHYLMTGIKSECALSAKETGLSQESLNAVRFYTQNGKGKALNALLTSPKLMPILGLIYRAATAPNAIDEILQSKDGKTAIPGLSQKFVYESVAAAQAFACITSVVEEVSKEA